MNRTSSGFLGSARPRLDFFLASPIEELIPLITAIHRSYTPIL